MSWLKLAAEPEEKPEGVGSKEMAMGREVEKEHLATIKWLIGKLSGAQGDIHEQDLVDEAVERIAQDHLKELPDYYTRLKTMEQGSNHAKGSPTET